MTIALGADDHGAKAVTAGRVLDARLPGVATAAMFSIGAGVVHAGAIGIHAEHVTLARLFIISAVLQIAAGMVLLLRPSRWFAVIAAVFNLVFVGAWLTTRLTGISWVEGLETREPAQFTDTACAALGLVAAGFGLAAAIIGWRRRSDDEITRGATFPAMVVAAIAIPALFTGATHVHSHEHGETAGVVDESQPHDHGGAAPAGESEPHDHGGAVVPVDESQPHDHGDATTDTATTDTATTDTGTTDTGTTDTATTDTAHVHAPAAVPTVAYDPTKPIDLGGVPGVTPEQQARAENLVAITVVRLPQWSDPAVAEAAGFHSIGDALTGFEHYINWDWINDDDFLDPDHPESLVYTPQPDGTKKLVSAMYMLPDTVSLADVPDIGGALTQWHIHDNLCFTKDPVAPHVAGITDATGGCPASLQKFRPAPMIHVWITPNVCGPFAALEGVGAGQIQPGEERLCDHAHGSSGTLGG